MFRLAMESGARLNIANKQNLTPLTLAAKLAKKEVLCSKFFLHLLQSILLLWLQRTSDVHGNP